MSNDMFILSAEDNLFCGNARETVSKGERHA